MDVGNFSLLQVYKHNSILPAACLESFTIAYHTQNLDGLGPSGRPVGTTAAERYSASCRYHIRFTQSACLSVSLKKYLLSSTIAIYMQGFIIEPILSMVSSSGGCRCEPPINMFTVPPPTHPLHPWPHPLISFPHATRM